MSETDRNLLSPNVENKSNACSNFRKKLKNVLKEGETEFPDDTADLTARYVGNIIQDGNLHEVSLV